MDEKDYRVYKIPLGAYTLDLKAEGCKIFGVKPFPFAVKASASIVGEVKAVKIENGTTTVVIINGKTVTRDKYFRPS